MWNLSVQVVDYPDLKASCASHILAYKNTWGPKLLVRDVHITGIMCISRLKQVSAPW